MAHDLHVVILAAGSGSRMHSAKPKILHTILGKPMVQHVIDAAKTLQPKKIWLIYGHESAQLQQAINDTALQWVEQNPRLGTGHALQVLLSHLPQDIKAQDRLLILSADGPAISHDTLLKLLQHADAPIVLLNIILADPTGFGRIVRDPQGKIVGIVEHKDATFDELCIQEIYSGIMLVEFSALKKFLPQLSNHNKQKEYYLTELINLAAADGITVESIAGSDPIEAKGVNDRVQLAELERAWQLREAKKLMLKGVTLADPHRFDLRGNLQVEHDVYIDINCVIEGEVRIGTGAAIGAHCILKDCEIGAHVEIKPYTFIDGAVIGAHTVVGPFARIRPGTELASHVHVGNFVEIKKTQVGPHSKINHLSYIGDAEIGQQVNVGAGTITCNYDGVNKHLTQIKDNAFIGSNVSLVAPVIIGEGATIGAGSTVTREAPPDQLTVGRAKQVSLPSWQRPKKKKKE